MSTTTQPTETYPTAADALTHAIASHRRRERISEFACVALPLTDHQRTDPRYRILEDTHCIRHPTDADREALKTELVETGHLTVLDESSTFITLQNPDPDPVHDAELARRILDTLYGVGLASVHVEEVVHDTDRTTYWPA